VDVWPSNVGPTPPGAALAMASAQDASKTHPHPAIQRHERRAIAVFEVLEPASEHCVETGDDGFHAVAVVPLREAADLVLQLREALLTWPFLVAFEVVTEEIESSGLAHVYKLGLLRMEREPPSGHFFA